MKKTKHCKILSQQPNLPAKAQDAGGGPRSALEIKKAGLIELGILVENARRASPWFY